MSLLTRIARNTAYQVVGKTAGAVLGIITIGIITRYLGQTGFGYYTTAFAFTQFFGVLVDFGLQMTTTQMISKPGADEEKIFNNALSIRFFSSLIFLGLAALFGWLMPYPVIIKIGISVISLSFFFISLQSVVISLYQKKINMAKVAMAEIWGRAALFLGVVLAARFDLGLIWILAAIVFGNLLNLILLFCDSRRYTKARFAFDFKIWQNIWHRTWPLAITIALTLVYFRADTVVLSLFRPQNEVGLYGATYKVLEVLTQFPYLFLGIILPLLTNFLASDKARFYSFIQKSFDFLAIVSLPMVFGAWVLGEKIMILVAGGEFALSGVILKILILAVAAIYFSALFGYGIVAAELQKKMIGFYIFNAVLSLVLYFILIPIYSYWAAAWLTVLSETIMAISAFYVLKKNIGVSFDLRVFGKATLCSMLMALAVWVLGDWPVLIQVVFGAAVYFGALLMIKTVDKQTIKEIISLKTIK